MQELFFRILSPPRRYGSVGWRSNQLGNLPLKDTLLRRSLRPCFGASTQWCGTRESKNVDYLISLIWIQITYSHKSQKTTEISSENSPIPWITISFWNAELSKICLLNNSHSINSHRWQFSVFKSISPCGSIGLENSQRKTRSENLVHVVGILNKKQYNGYENHKNVASLKVVAVNSKQPLPRIKLI